MTKKLNSLTVLFIVTVVMFVLMIATVQQDNDTEDDFAILFPGLLEQLNDVNKLHFKSSQDEFTLFKNGEDWFVKERWNYHADFNQVKRALVDIAEAKILERKTEKEDEHYILGVEGVDQGGETIHITMLNGDETVAGILLGHEREIQNNTGARQYYVRRAGETRTWLAEGYLNINPLMLNWIKSEVVNIARERIAKLTITQPSGEALTIVNTGAKDKFGVPETMDKTIFKYQQLGYDMAGTLFQLTMEDVTPEIDFSRGEAEVVTAEFITFDGLKVTVETSFIDGFYYSTFTADYDASLVTTAPADIQQTNTLKPAEQVRAEAERLNKNFSGWVYRFGGFVGTNLMRARADAVVEQRNQAIPMPPDVTGMMQ